MRGKVFRDKSILIEKEMEKECTNGEICSEREREREREREKREEESMFDFSTLNIFAPRVQVEAKHEIR